MSPTRIPTRGQMPGSHKASHGYLPSKAGMLGVRQSQFLAPMEGKRSSCRCGALGHSGPWAGQRRHGARAHCRWDWKGGLETPLTCLSNSPNPPLPWNSPRKGVMAMPFGSTSDHRYVKNSMDLEFQVYKYKTILDQNDSLQKRSGLGLSEMVTLNSTLHLITVEWNREMRKTC